MKTYQELRTAGTPGDWRPVLINREYINLAPASVQVHCSENYHEGLANAQLIAHEHNHFPKLLAALEDAISLSHVPDHNWDGEHDARMAACHEAFDAAITITEDK